jgi:hypothetical protein
MTETSKQVLIEQVSSSELLALKRELHKANLAPEKIVKVDKASKTTASGTLHEPVTVTTLIVTLGPGVLAVLAAWIARPRPSTQSATKKPPEEPSGVLRLRKPDGAKLEIDLQTLSQTDEELQVGILKQLQHWIDKP